MSKEKYNGHKGVKTDQGKMVRHGTPKTIGSDPVCDGGGSAELAKAAKSIYAGNRAGGLKGV
jgi:hypothetical protein